jgi:tRNA(fMet)-specific endonuclease VapC
MATRYLLDTNILSDLVKHPQGRVAEKIAKLPTRERTQLCTSIVVAAELRYGTIKKGSAILTSRIDQLLDTIEVLPLEMEADRHYGRIRFELEKKGTIIGANDMLIAAHVLAVDAVLVTDNFREFERVRGLHVENWITEKGR